MHLLNRLVSQLQLPPGRKFQLNYSMENYSYCSICSYAIFNVLELFFSIARLARVCPVFIVTGQPCCVQTDATKNSQSTAQDNGCMSDFNKSTFYSVDHSDMRRLWHDLITSNRFQRVLIKRRSPRNINYTSIVVVVVL